MRCPDNSAEKFSLSLAMAQVQNPRLAMRLKPTHHKIIHDVIIPEEPDPWSAATKVNKQTVANHGSARIDSMQRHQARVEFFATTPK